MLACLVASCALAQGLAEVPPAREQPLAAVDLYPSLTDTPGPLSGHALASDMPLEVEASDVPSKPDPLDAFLGYRSHSNSFDWIAGNGDQFGTFSLNSDHYQKSGANHGFDVGFGFHFLSGPVRTDMPPRVFDFSIAYQHRDRLGVFGYDVAASVTASSDFEGSSREGIRFPGHAVGFLSLSPTAELAFGVDYLDRGDLKLLPVGGLILMPRPDVRLELIFPRPRAVFQLTEEYQLYLSGELGGGTWAIERDTLVDDLATYRDLRLCVGLGRVKNGSRRSAVEIGYLFDRRLEYTSGPGNYDPIDTAMVRFVHAY